MTRYSIAGGVLRADLAGKEVLLNTDTGVYHLVNPTGRHLIASMEAGQSFEEAVQSLADAEGESYERIERDAQAFVDAMLSRALLEVMES